VLLAIISVFFILNRFSQGYWEVRKFQYQLTMLILTLISGGDDYYCLTLQRYVEGQLLTLLGALLSASIAFSSTTFIGNILAGLMLKVIKNIKLGDFITVSDVTGRATEMSLLHVEVQTEQRIWLRFLIC
jgi:small conductance mechanosensitive channel